MTSFGLGAEVTGTKNVVIGNGGRWLDINIGSSTLSPFWQYYKLRTGGISNNVIYAVAELLRLDDTTDNVINIVNSLTAAEMESKCGNNTLLMFLFNTLPLGEKSVQIICRFLRRFPDHIIKTISYGLTIDPDHAGNILEGLDLSAKKSIAIASELLSMIPWGNTPGWQIRQRIVIMTYKCAAIAELNDEHEATIADLRCKLDKSNKVISAITSIIDN